MSISLALSSALSGLSVSTRGTQIVANNIANAQTDAYAVRSLTQSSRVIGGLGNGVTVGDTIRHTDPGLLAELRNAKAENQLDRVHRSFWQAVETQFGLPGEAGSLTQLLNTFEAALKEASVTPDQPAVLLRVNHAAKDIVQKFNRLDELISQERDKADAAIAHDISQLNEALEGISTYNSEIQRQSLLGGEPSGLKDQRQALVDKVSELLPVREFPREDGRIMLLGGDGSILVDRHATQFSFTRSIEPPTGNSVENGTLSLVSRDGRNIIPDSDLFSAGQIGANLKIRDQSAPHVQNGLDRLAADLVQRFASQDLDPSLTPGQAGLFSISGHLDIPLDIEDFSGLIRLNPAIDTSIGGELWRLRDGVAATELGSSADNRILNSMIQALDQLGTLDAAIGPAQSVHDHATELLTQVTTERVRLEDAVTRSAARSATLQETLASRGVDTDAELSRLLVLEQAYAANARVLATVDSMLRTILEI